MSNDKRLNSCLCAVAASEVPWYNQCGGKGYEGPTTCFSGSECKVINKFYSQVQHLSDPAVACLPASPMHRYRTIAHPLQLLCQLGPGISSYLQLAGHLSDALLWTVPEHEVIPCTALRIVCNPRNRSISITLHPTEALCQTIPAVFSVSCQRSSAELAAHEPSCTYRVEYPYQPQSSLLPPAAAPSPHALQCSYV